ncbi:MAG: pyruvate, water dikinase regulatory protein [Pseudomonadota bacterium]
MDNLPSGRPIPSAIKAEEVPSDASERSAGTPPAATYFHVHLLSDSTGETLNTMLKASASQFAAATPFEHIYAFIRTKTQLEKAIHGIESAPGLVLHTIVNPALRRHLEMRCSEINLPVVSVLDPLTSAFSDYLGLEQTLDTGARHRLDDAYFKRIAALDYTLAHDDGQMTGDLNSADVVLVGVSRTSKTPTCMYLANRGVKAANVPLVPTSDPPTELFSLTRPLIVGLIASPDRLGQIRKNRLGAMNVHDSTSYADEAAIKAELLKAKRMFAKHRWPVIDVTRRSVEETAAQILTKLSARLDQRGK